jgi:cysteine desulfurase
VIQPVERVAELAHAAGAVLHCDAVQAAGKVRLDLAGLGVDLISLSAHKLGGPPGCGALVVGDAVALSPQVRGGGQERGRRAGTENTPAIVGFGIAAEMARLQIDTMQRLACLRDELEARVRGAVPRAHVIGHSSDRLPNTSCVALPGLASETQVIALDLAGVGVGAGSACSSGKVRPSHVLKAMGLTDEVAASAIRVSLGWQSTSADVSGFVTAWLAIVARHGARDSVPQTAA